MGSDKPDYTLGISILEQALANLTAVVSAVDLDIRSLTATDVPHQPLPYNQTMLHIKNEDAISNNDGYEKHQTIEDWGISSGKDFYINYAVIIINVPANAYYKYWHGFLFHAYEVDNVNDPFIWGEGFNPRTRPCVRFGARGVGWIMFTVSTIQSKINNNNELWVTMNNNSGQSIPANTITLDLIGVEL